MSVLMNLEVVLAEGEEEAPPLLASVLGLMLGPVIGTAMLEIAVHTTLLAARAASSVVLLRMNHLAAVVAAALMLNT